MPYTDLLAWRLKRIRLDREWLQEDVAQRARTIGLRWSQATVAAIEGRRRNVSLGEVLLLPLIYDLLLEDVLTAPDDPEAVVDVEGVLVKGPELRALIRGTDVQKKSPLALPVPFSLREQLEGFKKIAQRYGVKAPPIVYRLAMAAQSDAHRKAARRLDVSPFEVVVASWVLWKGRTLPEERDRRLDEGAGERSRRAGHVTRRLVEELRPFITSRSSRGRGLATGRLGTTGLGAGREKEGER